MIGSFEAKEDNDQNKVSKWSNQIAIVWYKIRILHKTKKEENKGVEILFLLVVIKGTRNHDTGRGQKDKSPQQITYISN